MQTSRKIELLAPAKNLECGIEAINHGADAIYIGAPMFGARAAAGNSMEDIASLTSYAHLFGAKVYVALNTILTDKDLEAVEQLIWDLYDKAKVDALIIQDMGITMLKLPPIPLHASTQMDNRSGDKAKFLEDAGFQQIVLARELTVDEIRTVAKEINTPLEVFVHGALCVCYSGQCYLSQAMAGRSANKGACAQYCRLPYTMEDAEGEEIVNDKHLLSMKDLNLSEHLEELIDAGASSLKIEGRLKDVNYVKNVVAYYRQKLGAILERRPEYKRASSGKCTYTFTPDAERSFNRGFTSYFFHDRDKDIWSVDSPKSKGKFVGTVVDTTPKFIKIRSTEKLNNGDGLCFLNLDNELTGLQVNRVDGDRIFALNIPEIEKGTKLYRNYDHEFEKVLANKTSERKINVDLTMRETPSGFTIEAKDEDNNSVALDFDSNKELAQKSQLENIKRNLSKTGNTIFEVKNIDIQLSQDWFIPSSALSEWRRLITDTLLEHRIANYKQDVVTHKQTTHAFPLSQITYLGNVMNEKSKQFYTQHQATVLQPAYEAQKQNDVPLMFTRHCVKQSLGYCPKESKTKHPYKEPFYLKYKNTRLRLNFDCKQCEMKVYND